VSRSSCDETFGLIAAIDGLTDAQAVACWFAFVRYPAILLLCQDQGRHWKRRGLQESGFSSSGAIWPRRARTSEQRRCFHIPFRRDGVGRGLGPECGGEHQGACFAHQVSSATHESVSAHHLVRSLLECQRGVHCVSGLHLVIPRAAKLCYVCNHEGCHRAAGDHQPPVKCFIAWAPLPTAFDPA
jgi:hypothetical protein